MLILPLPTRPDWSRPPVVTLAIMALCLLVYFVQGADDRRYGAALEFYQKSSLGKLESAAYRAALAQQNDGGQALERFDRQPFVARLRQMESDADFMARLRGGRVILPEHPEHASWQRDRKQYEQLRARVFTEQYALQGKNPSLATLFSHMFLHAGIMHLAGNMAVLFVVGYTVEAALGRRAFLGLYLLGGLGSAVPELFHTGPELRLALGASGASSAVMAAYLVLFGRRCIDFFYWLFFFFGTVRLPALAILPLWLANELLQRYVLDVDGKVNYLAHFAGFVSGALLVGLYRWRRRGRSAALVHAQDRAEAMAALRRQAEQRVAALQFDKAALHYRALCARFAGNDPTTLSEYLRIAHLSRQPEFTADASRRFVTAAAAEPSAFAPDQLARALLEENPPALDVAQWQALFSRIIDGRQLDAAETLLLRLYMQTGKDQALRPALRKVARKLGEAFRQAGQPERAEPLWRLAGVQASVAA
ncbi:MAG: rhomboid family intramembrane serine protease [Azonexus sp.]